MLDLHQELYKAEIAERTKRGLPLQHVLDIAQFPFFFALGAVEMFNQIITKLAAENPNLAHLAMSQVMGALARRDHAGANAFMERFRTLAPADPMARMRFGHVPAGPFVDLPPVLGAYPKTPAIFLACDAVYFDKYCMPMLRSMAANSPMLPVHVHLMSGDDSTVAPARGLPLALTVTYEDPRQLIARLGILPSHYYGAARLVRFAEALEDNPGPLWMADVDGLVTGDAHQLLKVATPAALRIRPGRVEPWHQFSACLIMGSAASRDYFRRVAAIVREDLPYAWWGMDQYALFSAAIGVKPQISLLGPEVAGAHEQHPGLFWFTGGQALKKSLATDQNPYAVLFRRFQH
ncbi:MAG: hypothetical protein K1X51_05270 [Rhodospirillaceae bacterium]|nr:hypothetical protein [Rhodospirillaceae bacterium]